jgi:hypothetical protein
MSSEPPRSSLPSVAPLFAAAAFAWLIFELAPRVRVPSALIDPLAVALAVVPALLALGSSHRHALRALHSLAVLLFGVSLLVGLYLVGLTRELCALQVLGLLAVGRGAGGLIGDRVLHPGHVLPACVVAATADVLSVLSPEGVSAAIVSSDRALSVAALAAPVLGSTAITFVLGAGDLVMMGLLFSVARRFDISGVRVGLALALGLGLAFALSAAFERPVPALVTMGVAVTALVPRFARLQRPDRRAALIASTICAALVGVALWRSMAR